MELGEGVNLNVSETSPANTPEWAEVTLVLGKRTQELSKADPRLGRLKSLKLLENLVPGSETGIVLYPGLDHATDDEALEMGHDRQMSVFHLKYPADSRFSIRREVAQTLDHTEAAGVKKYHIVAGSWGGIPAFNTVYTLLQEGSAEVESFFTVVAAFQPSDLAFMVREIGGRFAYPAMKLKSFAMPGRQIMSRIARGIPDFKYDDPSVLEKLAEVPTVILVPPGANDWFVDARKSHERYFPKAHVIEYPAYTNFVDKIKRIGGHDSTGAIEGIRQIEKSLFDNPKQAPPIPLGFRAIR